MRGQLLPARSASLHFEVTFETNTNTVVVVTTGMSTYAVDRSATVNVTILGDEEVIANAYPTTVFVPAMHLNSGTMGSRCVVQDNAIDRLCSFGEFTIPNILGFDDFILQFPLIQFVHKLLHYDGVVVQSFGQLMRFLFVRFLHLVDVPKQIKQTTIGNQQR